MIVACWAAKGGAGTSVVAAGLAVVASRTAINGALLVDLAGDAPLVLGLATEPEVGVHAWLASDSPVAVDGLARLEVRVNENLSILPAGRMRAGHAHRVDDLIQQWELDGRTVIVDCGTLNGLDGAATAIAKAVPTSLAVTRCCYLAVRRYRSLGVAASGGVVVCELGRALRPRDVTEIMGVPLAAEVKDDPQVGRLVDSGTFVSRLGGPFEKSLRGVLT